MTVAFDDLGFAVAYDVEVDPEFPSAGRWSIAVHHFHRDGRCDNTEEFRSRWGPPIVARIRPDGEEAWVAMAEAGGLHSFSGAFGAPGETTLAIISGGCGYVVDVLDPDAYAVIPATPVTGVSAEPALGLLFLVTFCELIAVDRDGLLWVTERLVLDDLQIQRVTPDLITATGTTIEGAVRASVTVDPTTGALVSAEPRLPKQMSAPPRWHR
jgi:hypothetical protein